MLNLMILSRFKSRHGVFVDLLYYCITAVQEEIMFAKLRISFDNREVKKRSKSLHVFP